jgi:lipopolysaccharide transport system permease protein
VQDSEVREARIAPPSRLPRPDVRGLFREADLVYYLAWRDVKVLYKQTVLGAAWVVIQPLAMTAIATLIFNRVAHVSSNGMPYPIFALAGFLAWGFFSSGVLSATQSLVRNRDLITKVYFPRLALPVAGITASLLNLVVGIAVLLIVMGAYGRAPHIQFLLFPCAILLVALTTFAVGLLTSAVNVLYRDVAQAVPFAMQAGLFLTPVFYPLSSLPGQRLRDLYALNPMTGCVEVTRWILVGGPGPSGPVLGSLGVTAVILVVGLLYFARVEQTFADAV